MKLYGNALSLSRPRQAAGADEETILAVLGDFKVIYAAICEDHTRPYEGIMEMLAALRERGIRVAVVSNKFDAATKQLCEKYFGELVEVAIGERAGVRKKPAPDTVYETLKELGVTAEGRTEGRDESAVYIGDSDVDIETARNCGMPCISVTWGLRDEGFLIAKGATVLVDTAEKLLGVTIA